MSLGSGPSLAPLLLDTLLLFLSPPLPGNRSPILSTNAVLGCDPNLGAPTPPRPLPPEASL
eukprot:12044427-Karenia_brevis.AAC.1